MSNHIDPRTVGINPFVDILPPVQEGGYVSSCRAVASSCCSGYCCPRASVVPPRRTNVREEPWICLSSSRGMIARGGGCLIHTHTHAHAHTYTRTHTRTHTHTRAHTHKHACTHSYTRPGRWVHAHAHTHTYTNARTHTHAQAGVGGV